MQKHEALESLRQAEVRADELRAKLVEAENLIAELSAQVGDAARVDRSRRTLARRTLHSEILAQLRDAVICLDREGVIFYWNESATRKFGWSADEMRGQHHTVLLAPEDRGTVDHQVRQALSGQVVRGERRQVRKDGETRWIEYSMGSVHDAAGGISGVVLVVRDITQRKAAEAELQRAAGILGQLQDIVIYCGADYRISYVNEAFEHVFGHRRSAALGQDITFRLPPEVHPRVRSYQERVLEGEALSLEWEDYRLDGSRVWIHWRCQPVLDADGSVRGVINIGTDIDRRKRVEHQREELQKQLLQAQRLDTLGSLAGGVAHDFNNILTAINGFTELALLSASQAEAKPYHERVLKACERARHLVKRILSFSRFHEPERQWVRLRELLDETSKFIRAALPATIELAGRVDDDCPPTLADPHQVNQVLLNLVTNAAHAIGHNKGRIEINLRREVLASETKLATGLVAAGAYAVIDVTDTGHGMDPVTQAKIFDPFFTTKQEGEGTGLGLSVVSGILQGHAGGAAVTSEVGRGTTVSVYLPLTSDATDETDETVQVPLTGAKSPHETIAIVDDEEPILLAAEKLLQGLGYRTRVFRSGADLLRACEAAPGEFHLVLTDYTMPGLTGVEIALRLREKRHRVPVVIMTGYSSWLNAGVVETLHDVTVIKKPFGRAELGRCVREMLDRDRRVARGGARRSGAAR